MRTKDQESKDQGKREDQIWILLVGIAVGAIGMSLLSSQCVGL